MPKLRYRVMAVVLDCVVKSESITDSQANMLLAQALAKKLNDTVSCQMYSDTQGWTTILLVTKEGKIYAATE